MSVDAFMLLSTDIISYVLRKENVELSIKITKDVSNINALPFEEDLGQVVWHLRNQHKNVFLKLREEYADTIFYDCKTLVKYSLFALSNIEEEVFLMNLLKFTAFYADLVLICYKSGYFNLIKEVLIVFHEIYKRHLKSALDVVGLNALSRIAKQLIEFRKFNLIDNIAPTVLETHKKLTENPAEYRFDNISKD